MVGTCPFWKSASFGTATVQTAVAASQGKNAGMLQVAATQDYCTYLLRYGKTALARMDGTTDIALGDRLTCNDTGVFVKATAGDPSTGNAGEAFTTDAEAANKSILVNCR